MGKKAIFYILLGIFFVMMAMAKGWLVSLPF